MSDPEINSTNYRNRPRDSRTAIFTALIGFGIFAVIATFYEPSRSSTEDADSQPPPFEALAITDDRQFDFGDLGLSFDPSRWPEQVPLSPTIFATSNIAPDALIDALLQHDTQASAQGSEVRADYRAKLDALSPSQVATLSPRDIKAVAEQILVSFTPPDTAGLPAYNAASRTLASIRQRGSWQCASGTQVFQLTALRQPADALFEKHLVQIFERGHVLPGFMRWRSGEWHLYGLEMTVRGAGLKSYGATALLGTQGLALRIVSIPEALILTALSDYATNASAVAVKILRDTAQRYAIPLAELERNVQAELQAAAAAQAANDNPTDAVRATWAFGRVYVPEGDIPLIFAQTIPLTDTHLPFTEILAERAAQRETLSKDSEGDALQPLGAANYPEYFPTPKPSP